MKTEERAELKKNELTEILAAIEPYWRAIVGGIVVVLTAVLALGVVSSNQRAARESGWAAFFAASANRDPKALETLADEQGNASVAPWAYYAAGQGRLVEGSTQVAKERALAKQNFEDAAASFTKAIALAGNYDLINQRSHWGLAQAQEGMNDLDKAQASYQAIVDKWPDAELAKQAQARIDSLKDPATRAFYDWYFAQTPPTTAPPVGGDTSVPFGDISNEPSFGVPDVGSDGTAADGGSGGPPSADDLSLDGPDNAADSGDAESVPQAPTQTPDATPDTTPDSGGSESDTP